MMTVPVVSPSGSYVSDGTLTPRAIGFPFLSPSHIAVTVGGVARVLNTHYEISGVYPSATLVPLTGFATNGQTVRYRRQTTVAQDYAVSGIAIIAKSLERSLDRAAMAVQEFAEDVQRSVRVPVGETASELPAAADRQGRVLGFGAGGTFIAVANDSAAVADDVARAEAAAETAEEAVAGIDGAVAAAQADADRADLAAAAAALSAGLYANEAAGRAAVADGVRFSAVGSTSSIAVDIWQRVNSGASTLLRSYPSLAALNAAIASLTAVTQFSALHDERRTGFLRIEIGQGWTPNADGTVNAPAGVSVQWYVDTLPASWAADKAASRPINFSIDIISGLLDGTTQIEQYAAINRGGAVIGSPTPMTAGADGKVATITLDPTCLSLRVLSQSTAGAVIGLFGGASLYPARVSRDANFLAAQGAARAQLDTVVPITITDTTLSAVAGGAAYDYSKITLPGGGSCGVFFAAKGVFADGDSGVFTFQSNLPLGAINQGIITVYDPGGGHGPSGSIPIPNVIQYAEGCYAAAFQVQSPGGEACYGLKMTLNNISGATRVISNFQLWKGITTPPPFTKVPAMLADYISRQARFEALALSLARFPITCLGDSETQFSPDQKNWPQWLQTLVRDRAEIRPRGVPGDVADDMLLRGGFKDCAVTGVVGGVIPADTTPVAITGFDIRPGSPYSIVTLYNRQNPDAYPLVYLENVLGRIWCNSFDAANPPQPTANAVFFQRLTAGEAVPVTASSKLIWQDGLVSKRHRVICLGTYNSAAATRTTADTMFAQKLALDGSYKNMLFIPYGVALATSPTNPHTASMIAAYPGQVLDINYAPTAPEQAMLTAKFGSVWTASATISEMAAGYIPQILKWDNVHFMEPGAYLIATRIYTWVLANWMTP